MVSAIEQDTVLLDLFLTEIEKEKEAERKRDDLLIWIKNLVQLTATIMYSKAYAMDKGKTMDDPAKVIESTMPLSWRDDPTKPIQPKGMRPVDKMMEKWGPKMHD